jgi:MATE family multidrug resistance protein
MCALVMTVSAIVILLFNDQIAALYTRDLPVRELAASLLLMAALFQFSDGVQVGAAGALRGFKDTTIPMALCIFSYWVVGFTFAYYYGVYRGEGPRLVWVGLNVGLTISAVLLVVRYWRVTKARLNDQLPGP